LMVLSTFGKIPLDRLDPEWVVLEW
jgi:hypothetical protein